MGALAQGLPPGACRPQPTSRCEEARVWQPTKGQRVGRWSGTVR
ncbi:unnamed protein product [Heligmosomoides polygyrus]|uniref:Uncharacterized protein n=1 Tax=Heligmosomoides polygyrus TaxID=6339 RepID=A0A3P7TJQ9_HELPZ|nr:unnamed protein product [Heligmosomoides polygyrus]